MPRIPLLWMHTLALIVAGIFNCAGPALAENPAWNGKDRPDRHEDTGLRATAQHLLARDASDSSSRRRRKEATRKKGHFLDSQRTVLREYYAAQYRAGQCPPGLIKKYKACLPPGQAKKWVIGQPLPREVVFYPLPPAVVEHLGPPPAGHHYARVANDILLIAVGTGLVTDAIQDWGR